MDRLKKNDVIHTEDGWENEEVLRRYESAVEKILHISYEKNVPEPYFTFFLNIAGRVQTISENVRLVNSGEWNSKDLDFLKKNNFSWYGEWLDVGTKNRADGYENCLANPAYAVSQFGVRIGRALSFVYAECIGLYAFAMEKRIYDMVVFLELILEIYEILCHKDEAEQRVESALSHYVREHMEETYRYRIRETLDPTMAFAKDIVMGEDLTDLSYLYRFGEYVSDNEVRMAGFMNGLPRKDVEDMAHTFTEGFRRGFELNRVDLAKKKTVQIRYMMGMERMVREAVRQFDKMGLKVILPRNAVSRRQPVRGGYQSLRPYRQFTFDHQFDDALYLNEDMVEYGLTCLRSAYESYRDLAGGFAGPAVVETFGEKPFSPRIQSERLSYDEKKQVLARKYQSEAGRITNEYIKKEEYGFTIVAFPIPEIGSDFPAIFRETVKVNTLDNEQYGLVQQTIIDALDKGEYVRVTGRESAGNRTDLKVCLAPLANPEKETRFENCLADVNIPLGEVFTSPRLTGTEGILHISETYLKELRYVDLMLRFTDGMVTDYHCRNFKEEEKNRSYIKENLLFHHDSLPMGEFAIGTNTTAYRMGKKYNISHKLPILIMEKTGLHVAVGDTCYSMSEDRKVFNPDGKEVVARENECSALRKTDREKAYFYCHTDITVPYDELGDVVVYHEDGSKEYVIRDGRFVLKGTEALNEAFTV